MQFKFLAHTADVKFRAFGSKLEKVFENSALAFKGAIYDKKVEGKESKKIEVKGKDFESLLYNFLEELLFLLESEGFLFNKIKEIKIDTKNFKLKAIVTGDKASNYNFTNNVKAITYHEMFVKKIKNKFVAQVVLDV